MASTLKNFLSVTEAAELLGVTRQQVLKLINSGTLKAEKLGIVYAVSADSVKNYEAKDRKPGRPPSKKSKRIVES